MGWRGWLIAAAGCLVLAFATSTLLGYLAFQRGQPELLMLSTAFSIGFSLAGLVLSVYALRKLRGNRPGGPSD